MFKNPKYLYGQEDIVIPYDLNYGAFTLRKWFGHGDKIALINGETGETVTYRTLAQNAVNLAVSLARLGVRKGETVIVCSENRTEFWSTVIGVICAGAVLSTINMAYSKDELTHVMNIAKPKYVFCSPLAYKLQGKNLRTLDYVKKIIVFDTVDSTSTLLYRDLVSKHVNFEEFEVVEVQGQIDTVMLLYSSGTTGLPKGVMLTHHNCLVSASMPTGGTALPELTGLIITPWFHTMGLVGTLNSMTLGRTNVYLPKFELKTYLDCIQKYKIGLLVVVPPVVVILTKTQLLDKYDLSTVMLMYCGAAPLDLDTTNEVKKRFPNLLGVLQGYGMTEATLAIIRDSPFNTNGFKAGSVGNVSPGTTIKIVDIESREVLGPHKSGEICVKGPLIMKGYVGKDRKHDFDKDGFFKTGDIGYYDEDKYVFIVDRLKELIKYKGFQVPPAELEAVLLQHDAVLDSAVVGVPHKMSGEVPLAFVVKKPGSDVTEQQIVDFVAGKLSNPKHLRGGVRFIEQIPKSASGKILRRMLKKMVKSKNSKL